MVQTTRRKIVAGNWKMNGSLADIESYVQAFKFSSERSDLEVILAPPSVYIGELLAKTANADIAIAAQNVSSFESGAYTGEVSAQMLVDLGVEYSLIGHSERRALFAESDEAIADKVAQLLEKGLKPILCVGETLEQREAGQAELVVNAQLSAVLNRFDSEQLESLVVAYEPVWAIGTGKTATPEVAQQMHASIRRCIAEKSEVLAQSCVLLYGGSVNAGNAEQLFAQEDIDGGLVGGASLKPEEFMKICQSIG